MKIRAATTTDIAALARVHVQSWLETYTGLMPTELLQSITIEDRERQWHQTLEHDVAVWVAECAGGVVGLTSLGQARDGGLDAQLYTLYLLKSHQGQGIGKALWDAALEAARMREAKTLGLWVLATNPTRGFYERQGGQLAGQRTDIVRGQALEEVLYRYQLEEPQ